VFDVEGKRLGFYGKVLLGAGAVGALGAAALWFGDSYQQNLLNERYWVPTRQDVASARKLNRFNSIDSEAVARLCNEADSFLVTHAYPSGIFAARVSFSQRARASAKEAREMAAWSANISFINDFEISPKSNGLETSQKSKWTPASSFLPSGFMVTASGHWTPVNLDHQKKLFNNKPNSKAPAQKKPLPRIRGLI
jgi:hypothetical protein